MQSALLGKTWNLYKQRWGNTSNVVVWVCISIRKDWINYSATFENLDDKNSCLIS